MAKDDSMAQVHQTFFSSAGDACAYNNDLPGQQT